MFDYRDHLGQPFIELGKNESIERDTAVEQQRERASRNVGEMFLVPGMQHCAGGTIATSTYDSVAEMERWLDTGRAPERIEASHVENGVVTRTRPLCAHPNVAKYKPPGSAASTFNINDSYYFGCVDPTGKSAKAVTQE